jgi:hypothetical protein
LTCIAGQKEKYGRLTKKERKNKRKKKEEEGEYIPHF